MQRRQIFRPGREFHVFEAVVRYAEFAPDPFRKVVIAVHNQRRRAVFRFDEIWVIPLVIVPVIIQRREQRKRMLERLRIRGVEIAARVNGAEILIERRVIRGGRHVFFARAVKRGDIPTLAGKFDESLRQAFAVFVHRRAAVRRRIVEFLVIQAFFAVACHQRGRQQRGGVRIQGVPGGHARFHRPPRSDALGNFQPIQAISGFRNHVDHRKKRIRAV